MGVVERLQARLEDLPIQTAYLFGSQAEGNTGPLSDVDIAILPQLNVGEDQRLVLRGKVAERARAACQTEHADVVLLDEADPSLAFEAIQGELVLDRDPEARILAEARIMSKHYDRSFHADRWEDETLDRFRREAFG
jgi:predicted nucleotidyltransferase